MLVELDTLGVLLYNNQMLCQSVFGGYFLPDTDKMAECGMRIGILIVVFSSRARAYAVMYR